MSKIINKRTGPHQMHANAAVVTHAQPGIAVALDAKKAADSVSTKSMSTVPRNPILAAIHSAAAGLHGVGAIDKATMRSFDAACLVRAPALSPQQIVNIRNAANMSQPVFALHMGTTKSTIAKWESGEKAPSGPARKLLSAVAKHGIEILI